MNYTAAMAACDAGTKVDRAGWGGNGYVEHWNSDAKRHIRYVGGGVGDGAVYRPSSADKAATDWEAYAGAAAPQREGAPE